jgi:hypothetical protein
MHPDPNQGQPPQQPSYDPNQQFQYDPNQQYGYDPNLMMQQQQYGQFNPNAGFQNYDPNNPMGAPMEFQTYGPRKKQSWWARVGGGSLMVSIFVHAIFILIAIFLITISILQKEKQEAEDFLPGGGGGGKSNEAKQATKRRSVSMAQPKSRIAANVSTSAVVLPDSPQIATASPMSAMAAPSAGGMGGGEGGIKGKGKGGLMGDGFGKGFGPGMGPGFVAKLPPIMRSRCNPSERLSKMKENGGNEDCEKAVVKTLDWFAATQNPDGSWGKTWPCGMTGLVLLSFYGHCETVDSPKYGDKIMKAISYLLDVGAKNNGFFTTKIGSNHHCVYEHGIACYAMGETYSFSKLGNREMPGLRESFEKGVEIIINNQQDDGDNAGNWAYKEGSPHYAKYGREDMSVTGWQFQALRAAEHTSLKISGLKGAMKRTADYLERRSQPEGGIGHKGAKRGGAYSQYTMTGIGALGLQTLGGGSSSVVTKALKFIMSEADKDPLDWKKNGELYCWYYNTQAVFQRGGKDWDKWNGMFRDQVLKNQKADGTYNPESAEYAGATSSGAGGDANIYRSALCTLMLEVYYRYLKVGGGGH